jgi:ketosteroid isomerase-like protein
MRILLSLLLLAGFADLRPAWDSLVEAERNFARTSVAKGTKEAFLGVLADDSVIFRPNAVPGRKWFQENPAATIQLNWAPEYADIAIAGDLGYTTGPWEVRRTPQDEPVAFGHYVTLWRKQNGEWKVVIDNGISHERSPKPAKVDSPALRKQVGAAKSKTEITTATSALLRADRAATGSPADYLADDVRLYRDGSFPFVGKAAALQQTPQTAGVMSPDQHSFVSTSADLACTYGSIGGANFVRIWKKQRDGSWKIVIDLMTPAPKQ